MSDMTIDPDTASLLTDVEAVERRTRQAIYYGGASIFLILWGVLSTVGNLLEFLSPATVRPAWLTINLGGVAATVAIFYLRRVRAQQRFGDARIIVAQLFLVAFGMMWSWLLSDHDVARLDPFWSRQLGVFWTTLWMFGFILAGLWVGRFFLYCGLALTALSIAAYLWAGPWYPLWHAAALAIALIGGGLWLRRVGVRR
jgi:hypothetical protein